jgi:hypothetical protein
VELATADPLEDFGPLVLGHHPLHLQQQVVLRRLSDLVVEEDDLDVAPPEFIDEEHLVHIGPGQTVGRMHVEPVEDSGRRLIAQPLQGRADQRRAAVAVVDETEFLFQFQAVALNPLGEHLKLTGDRVSLDLPVRRDTGIHGRPG